VPTYKSVADRSRFTVQAFAGGLLSALAHNPTFAVRKFTATLHFDPESPAGASIEMTAESESLQLTDSVKPTDREEIERAMHAQVLETTKYPKITYRSSEIKTDKVTEGWFRQRIQGELSLHGMTKAHAMEATLRIQENVVRFTDETTIRLSDFRMKKISALAGTITLKEEVKLAFDFVMEQHPT
jgi:polyisoprenoid-binding protein YceI